MLCGQRLALTVVVLAAGCRSRPPYSGDWRDLRHGEQDSRWGFVDASGQWAIAPRFVDEGDFAEGLAWTTESNWRGIGYIDKTGAWAIKPQFRHATEFSEGLAAVQDKSGRWGYIDASGLWVIAPSFGSAQPFSEGLASVEVGATYRGPWGFIDKTGDLVIPARYEHSPGFLYWKSSFKDGVALIDKGTGLDFIAAVGDGRAEPFKRGLAPLDLDSPNGYLAAGAKWGYIDTSGRVVAKFTKGRSFGW